jgi:spore coat polysaccharide biosynthesis protein SpsF
MKRRLIAAIACRNQGSRLYGKPLQNLDVVSGVRIIDNIISCLQNLGIIDELILGISEGQENEVFKSVAIEKGLRYIVGDETDVLSRLIACGELGEATDIFRITSESPFLFHNQISDLWKKYQDEDLDAMFMDEIIDGAGFEIIKLEALKVSHRNGDSRHRSELCTLYIRENTDQFNIWKVCPPSNLIRKDLRLTVDNPEDLAVCRILYNIFKEQAPMFSLDEMVVYLDRNQNLKDLIAPFTENGYLTMNK